MGEFKEHVLRELADLRKGISRIENHLILQGVVTMSALDDLAAEVQANSDAEDSAIALIKGLADQIAANAGDQTKIAALAATLKSKAEALGAAVVANTPAPAPSPAPPVAPAPPADPTPAPAPTDPSTPAT